MGRVLAAIAAAVLAIGALSRWPAGPGSSGGTPGDATSQQSEDVVPDGAPTATGLPTTPAYAGTPQRSAGTG